MVSGHLISMSFPQVDSWSTDPRILRHRTAALSMSDDNVIMCKVNTHDNSTNMLTTSLFVAKFGHCLNLVGIC